MIKLLLITWSYDDYYELENKFIYRSKSIDPRNLIHIHFNRNNYKSLEIEFENRFGFQYEYILYKIFLIKEIIEKIDFDKFIYSDTEDVYCLKSFHNEEIPENLIFSTEIHKYPNNTSSWSPINDYNPKNLEKKIFLNSGLFYTRKKIFLELLENLIKNVLVKNYKDFGGDQGVYTYHYINSLEPLIELDIHSKYFLTTYLRSPNDFELSNNLTIVNKINNNESFFVHDNGWNYGSPKFIEHFKLL